jgi:hypothetical protein
VSPPAGRRVALDVVADRGHRLQRRRRRVAAAADRCPPRRPWPVPVEHLADSRPSSRARRPSRRSPAARPARSAGPAPAPRRAGRAAAPPRPAPSR